MHEWILSISHKNHSLPFMDLFPLHKKAMNAAWKTASCSPIKCISALPSLYWPHIHSFVLSYIHDWWSHPKITFVQDNALFLWLNMIIAFLEKGSNVNTVFSNYPQTAYLTVVFSKVYFIRHFHSNSGKEDFGDKHKCFWIIHCFSLSWPQLPSIVDNWIGSISKYW